MAIATIPKTQDTTLQVAVMAAIFSAAATALYVVAGIDPHPMVELFLAAGPLIAVILWLQKDAHRTGVGAVHDWGLFLWLAWPFVLPWYVFKSRGVGGWRLLIALFTLICSAYITGWASAGWSTARDQPSRLSTTGTASDTRSRRSPRRRARWAASSGRWGRGGRSARATRGST